jgi:hypothetical protein
MSCRPRRKVALHLSLVSGNDSCSSLISVAVTTVVAPRRYTQHNDATYLWYLIASENSGWTEIEDDGGKCLHARKAMGECTAEDEVLLVCLSVLLESRVSLTFYVYPSVAFMFNALVPIISALVHENPSCLHLPTTVKN